MRRSSNKIPSFTSFLLISVAAIAILVTASCYQIGFLNKLASAFIVCSSSSAASTSSSRQNGSSFFLSDISTGVTTSPNKIPKTLHFIHVSKNLLQDDDTATAADEVVLNNIQDWKTLQSDWTVELWTNQKVRAAFPDLLPLLLEIEQPRSWVANLLRYAILHRYGGVYLDTDVVPIRRLDALVEDGTLDSFTVCQTNRENSAAETLGSSWSSASSNNNNSNLQDLVVGWSKCDLACNAVIASKPRHPALLEALSTGYVNTNVELARRRESGGKGDEYKIRFSGPPMWTEVAKRHDVPVLYPDTFYPCNWRNTTLCDTRNFQSQPTTFAMHKWAKTWWLEEVDQTKPENTGEKEEAQQNTSPEKKSEADSTRRPSKDPFELLTKAQVGQEQAKYLLSFLPDKGNLLVWGLGNDSPFWTNVTTGRVIFLEDDIPSPKFGTLWYDHVMKLHPELEAYKVHYTTDVYNDYDKFMEGGADLWNQELDLKLSTPTSDITWDVILVDAPAGYGSNQPGRYQSIYTSFKLAEKSAVKMGRPVHVFVDDYNRKLERNFSQRVFGGKPNKVTTRTLSSGKAAGNAEANEQAHFVVEPATRPASNNK